MSFNYTADVVDIDALAGHELFPEASSYSFETSYSYDQNGHGSHHHSRIHNSHGHYSNNNNNNMVNNNSNQFGYDPRHHNIGGGNYGYDNTTGHQQQYDQDYGYNTNSNDYQDYNDNNHQDYNNNDNYQDYSNHNEDDVSQEFDFEHAGDDLGFDFGGDDNDGDKDDSRLRYLQAMAPENQSDSISLFAKLADESDLSLDLLHEELQFQESSSRGIFFNEQTTYDDREFDAQFLAALEAPMPMLTSGDASMNLNFEKMDLLPDIESLSIANVSRGDLHRNSRGPSPGLVGGPELGSANQSQSTAYQQALKSFLESLLDNDPIKDPHKFAPQPLPVLQNHKVVRSMDLPNFSLTDIVVGDLEEESFVVEKEDLERDLALLKRKSMRGLNGVGESNGNKGATARSSISSTTTFQSNKKSQESSVATSVEASPQNQPERMPTTFEDESVQSSPARQFQKEQEGLHQPRQHPLELLQQPSSQQLQSSPPPIQQGQQVLGAGAFETEAKEVNGHHSPAGPTNQDNSSPEAVVVSGIQSAKNTLRRNTILPDSLTATRTNIPAATQLPAPVPDAGAVLDREEEEHKQQQLEQRQKGPVPDSAEVPTTDSNMQPPTPRKATFGRLPVRRPTLTDTNPSATASHVPPPQIEIPRGPKTTRKSITDGLLFVEPPPPSLALPADPDLATPRTSRLVKRQSLTLPRAGASAAAAAAAASAATALENNHHDRYQEEAKQPVHLHEELTPVRTTFLPRFSGATAKAAEPSKVPSPTDYYPSEDHEGQFEHMQDQYEDDRGNSQNYVNNAGNAGRAGNDYYHQTSAASRQHVSTISATTKRPQSMYTNEAEWSNDVNNNHLEHVHQSQQQAEANTITPKVRRPVIPTLKASRRTSSLGVNDIYGSGTGITIPSVSSGLMADHRLLQQQPATVGHAASLQYLTPLSTRAGTSAGSSTLSTGTTGAKSLLTPRTTRIRTLSHLGGNGIGVGVGGGDGVMDGMYGDEQHLNYQGAYDDYGAPQPPILSTPRSARTLRQSTAISGGGSGGFGLKTMATGSSYDRLQDYQQEPNYQQQHPSRIQSYSESSASGLGVSSYSQQLPSSIQRNSLSGSATLSRLSGSAIAIGAGGGLEQSALRRSNTTSATGGLGGIPKRSSTMGLPVSYQSTMGGNVGGGASGPPLSPSATSSRVLGNRTSQLFYNSGAGGGGGGDLYGSMENNFNGGGGQYRPISKSLGPSAGYQASSDLRSNNTLGPSLDAPRGLASARQLRQRDGSGGGGLGSTGNLLANKRSSDFYGSGSMLPKSPGGTGSYGGQGFAALQPVDYDDGHGGGGSGIGKYSTISSRPYSTAGAPGGSLNHVGGYRSGGLGTAPASRPRYS